MREIVTILFRYGRPRFLTLAMAAGVVSGFASTAILAMINRLMNLDVAAERPSRLVWGFLALCLAIPAARMVSALVFFRLGTQAAREIRLELSQRILTAPLRQLEEVGPQRLLMALYRDTGDVSDAVTSVPLLSINVTLLLGCLVYMGWLSPSLLLIVLGLIVVAVLLYQLPITVAKRREVAVHEGFQQLFREFRSLTQGTKELKMHAGRRAAFLANLDTASVTLQRNQFAARLMLVGGNSLGSISAFLAIGFLFLVAPSWMEVRREVLTGYGLLLLFLTGPIEVILSSIPGLNRASVAALKLREIGLSLLERSEQEPAAVSPPAATNWTIWEFSAVTHTYYREAQDDRFVLGPINLSFSPREIVFVTGGNGSGKTTLAKLLIGLYTPESGEIRFEGRPVTNENREAYRQCFAVVFSDYFLFTSFLGLDTSPAGDERARDYLRRLQLEHKVSIQQGQLSTTDLSQGQRKRLALLTAYLEDRPIYVFDEWAADQDPYFKEVFYHQLLPELKMRGRTVIVISHDDRYYGVADRIIKLDDGRIESDLYLKPRAGSAPLKAGTFTLPAG